MIDIAPQREGFTLEIVNTKQIKSSDRVVWTINAVYTRIRLNIVGSICSCKRGRYSFNNGQNLNSLQFLAKTAILMYSIALSMKVS